MIRQFVFAAFFAGAAPAMADQAVIVHFNHVGAWSDFLQWEPIIEHAVSAARYEYDGNELASDGTDGTIYMYGPDADKLFAVALPELKKAAFLTHKSATLRYGDVNDLKAVQKTVAIDP